MRIQLLGSVRAYSDSGEALQLGGPKQAAFLCVLAADPGRPVSSDTLAEAIWGEQLPARPRRSIATYASNLNRVLGHVISSDAGEYRIDIDRPTVDSCAFSDAVRSAERQPEPARSEALRAALALWSGPPFRGVETHGETTAEAVRLEELHLSVAERVAQADMRGPDPHPHLAAVAQLVRDHPTREALREAHMIGLYRTARQTEALESYNDYRTALRDELGLDPSASLQDLELKILQHDPTLQPLLTEAPQEPRLAALPQRYSRFIGRERDTELINDRLDDHRLVTIVGPGGIGKSSISVEVLRARAEEGGRQTVRVDVERVEHQHLTEALATALALSPAPGVALIDPISGYLSRHPTTIFLDGCERHLDEVAMVVDRLLTSSSTTRIVASSREPIGIAGESVHRLDGLPTMDSVALFLDRADLDDDASTEAIGLVERICDGLDGIPLAIELVAAKARTLPLERLLEGLGNHIVRLRQRTSGLEKSGSLEASIAWSYESLAGHEQKAFRWLAVFKTGFSLRDAEGLVGSGSEAAIDRLVEVSLLQPEQDGYHRYLSPVRHVALSELERSLELQAALEQRAVWLSEEAVRVESDLRSPSHDAAMRWVAERQPELVSSIVWATDAARADIAVQIVAAIGVELTHVGLRGPAVEASKGAVMSPSATPSATLSVAMAMASHGLSISGRRPEATELHELAQSLANASKDKRARGIVLQRIAAHRAWFDGVTEELLTMFDEGTSLLREVSPLDINHNNHVVMLYLSGRFEDAHRAAREFEAFQIATLGRTNGAPEDHKSLLSCYRGDWGEALTQMELAIERREAALQSILLMESLENLGFIAHVLGQAEPVGEALERQRSLAEITGLEPSILLRCLDAHEQARPEDVVDLAGRWLAGVDQPGYRPLLGRKMSVEGDRLMMPALFVVALPIVGAMRALGHGDEADRIVTQIPGLMAQSDFRHWEEFRVEGRLASVRSTDVQTPARQWTLQEAHHGIRAMLVDAS